MKEKSKFTTISIPTPLFDKAKAFIEGKGFPSVSSFAAYLLRELIGGSESKLSSNDEQRVREKLKDLGYLD